MFFSPGEMGLMAVLAVLGAGAIGTLVSLGLLYVVVRLAVSHGVQDAAARSEARAVRAELGLGPERSPNSRA